ncbi:MAG: ABC transporter ATP-binding protein [Pseudomonadota bacterium]
MTSALVQMDNLSFRYGQHAIFDALSFSIPAHQVTAIMGPSGTGKTTLLKLIGGQLKPDSGKIYFHDQCINQLSRKHLLATRKKMGLLFQSSALFTNISVFDNIAFPLRAHTNLSSRLIKNIVLMKLEMVGLRGTHDMMPYELSGGMARRVALARALALDPELIMYDEPFTGLDPISMGVIVKLIKELNDSLRMTSIIVSHDVAEVSSIADYGYILSNAKVIAAGTPQQLAAMDNPAVKQFMHGLPDGVVPFHYPAKTYHEDLAIHVE